MLLVALAAQTLRFAAFGIGAPFVLVAAAIAMHGLCYAFFFTAAYIYIDEHSTRRARAGAQQLYTILIMGLGYFMGHSTAGKLGQWFLDPATGTIDFHKYWAVPAITAVLIGTFLAVAFHAEAPLSQAAPAPEEIPDADAM